MNSISSSSGDIADFLPAGRTPATELLLDQLRSGAAASTAQSGIEGAPAEELKVVIGDHVDALRRRIGRHPDKAILGCTHYEIVADLFAQALPAGTVLIEQPTAVADALERYFAQHPEYDLGDSGRRDFLTTGQAGPQSELVSQFWGAPVTFEKA